MKRSFGLCVLVWAMTAGLALLPARAETSRLYGSVSALYVMPSGYDSMSVELPVGYAEHDLSMDPGPGGLAAVGYSVTERLRGEVELGYRVVNANEIDGWTGAYDNAPLAVAGGFRTWSAMLNAYCRFSEGGLVPYVGAGVGVARHHVQMKSRTLKIGDKSGQFTFDGNNTVFAWQAMAGVAQPLAENVELRLGYRFFQTQPRRYGPDKLGYTTHNLEVGLAFEF